MSKKKINWLITDENITVNYEGQTHIVSRSDKLANQLIEAVKNERTDLIPGLVSAANRVEKFSKGNFIVDDGQILINGVPAPRVLSDKIVKFANEGLPYKPLIRFAENLQKNPSFRAVNELFTFLEKNDHPITENGCFIAYKKVRTDFKDAYTGTIDNSVGNTVEMPRNLVNEDPTQTCSHGLHVANWDYAHNIYGAGDCPVMLEVEVNPADVVAVPIDYNNAKMRVCKYLVLGTVDTESSSSPLRITNKDTYIDDDDDDDCDYCDQCGRDYDDDYPWSDEFDRD